MRTRARDGRRRAALELLSPTRVVVVPFLWQRRRRPLSRRHVFCVLRRSLCAVSRCSTSRRWRWPLSTPDAFHLSCSLALAGDTFADAALCGSRVAPSLLRCRLSDGRLSHTALIDRWSQLRRRRRHGAPQHNRRDFRLVRKLVRNALPNKVKPADIL